MSAERSTVGESVMEAPDFSVRMRPVGPSVLRADADFCAGIAQCVRPVGGAVFGEHPLNDATAALMIRIHHAPNALLQGDLSNPALAPHLNRCWRGLSQARDAAVDCLASTITQAHPTCVGSEYSHTVPSSASSGNPLTLIMPLKEWSGFSIFAMSTGPMWV